MRNNTGSDPARPAKAAKHAQAILARQPPVEQDQVPLTGSQRIPGRLTIDRVLDGEPFLAQACAR